MEPSNQKRQSKLTGTENLSYSKLFYSGIYRKQQYVRDNCTNSISSTKNNNQQAKDEFHEQKYFIIHHPNMTSANMSK